MPWLLTSPGHQQPWYWLCRIGRFLSYLRKDFNYLAISMWRNNTKCKYMFMFPLKNVARKGFGQKPNVFQRSELSLVHVMACCMITQSHYLNQWWLIIKEALSHYHIIHQKTRPTVNKIMACCLFSAKPLHGTLWTYCHQHCWEQTSVKFVNL